MSFKLIILTVISMFVIPVIPVTCYAGNSELDPILGIAMPDLTLPSSVNINAPSSTYQYATSQANSQDNFFYGLQYFYTPENYKWVSFGSEMSDFHAETSQNTLYETNTGSFTHISSNMFDLFMITPAVVRLNLPLTDKVGLYGFAGVGVILALSNPGYNIDLAGELGAGLKYDLTKKYSLFSEWRVQIFPDLGPQTAGWADILDLGVRIHF